MKAKKALSKIEEIMELEFDGYGEFMHPVERVAMIARVMRRYKKSQDAKNALLAYVDAR